MKKKICSCWLGLTKNNVNNKILQNKIWFLMGHNLWTIPSYNLNLYISINTFAILHNITCLC